MEVCCLMCSLMVVIVCPLHVNCLQAGIRDASFRYSFIFFNIKVFCRFDEIILDK